MEATPVPARAEFGDYPDDLPGSWETATAHEAAAELGLSWQAAAPLLHLAWEVEARLPSIGRLLDQGVLSAFKAKIVVDEFLPWATRKPPRPRSSFWATAWPVPP